jgi:hypothetical protein
VVKPGIPLRSGSRNITCTSGCIILTN